MMNDGTGVYVGHERCGGRSWRRDGCQHDCEGVTQRCFRWFWKEQRLRVRVLVLRKKGDGETSECRRMQRDHNLGQSKGSRMVDNKGRSERRLKCKCHECGKFGFGMSAREASAFEASKRVLAETTYVDMTSVDLNTLEIASLSLLERNLEFQSGIESHAAVMVFALLGVQKLQVLFGSECSKGDRQAPRCVTLVRESDVHSFDGSVRDEPIEPRCVLPLLL